MDAVNINIEELEHHLRQAGKLFQDRTAAGQVQTKGIADYVTAVDYAVQQYIQEHLEVSYPHIQFLSEEKANQEIDPSGLVWVLDPVDGTTNLIHDYHTSCISLALMGGGEVALGMIYNPYSKELFQAKKGRRQLFEWGTDYGKRCHEDGGKSDCHRHLALSQRNGR